jgi:hypothetical protein
VNCLCPALGISAKRWLLIRPTQVLGEVPLPVLVLFHALGETDPFGDAALRLEKRLSGRGLDTTLSPPAGPQEQTFPRQAATLELLPFQARALHAVP